MRAVLVTTGATRNPIDSMRYISANSSGRTGAWIADALRKVANVTVLGSSEALLRCPDSIRTQAFTTTQDLMDKMKAWAQLHPGGLIVHAAAVGDYQVTDSNTDLKLPSGQPKITVTLTPAPKILDAIRAWSDALTIVSFKAAPPHTQKADVESLASAQALRTDSAAVFANSIGALDRDVLFWTPTQAKWADRREDGLTMLADWLTEQCKD